MRPPAARPSASKDLTLTSCPPRAPCRTKENELAARQLSDETGQRCLALTADVRRPEDLEAAVKRTVDAFGGIDFVICGASGLPSRLLELSPAPDRPSLTLSACDHPSGAAGNFLAPIEGLSSNAFKTVIDIDLVRRLCVLLSHAPGLTRAGALRQLQMGTFNTIKATTAEVKKRKGAYVSISATLHYQGAPSAPRPPYNRPPLRAELTR